MTGVSPLSAVIAGILMPKRKPPAEYLVVVSTTLIVVGIGLMGSLPVQKQTPVVVYGYQIILGMGLGLLAPAILFILKYHIPDDDLGKSLIHPPTTIP
jgi:hypothetical protein